ncbi:MAG: ABC-F family ATP-binding cassette domain-containing protein [Lachnospiraceae bacterium]|nr:ABC-F family ATP-binding cassette domain-containing protein [Lachnospiraceae bacterium]MDD3659666.1 ABC-F family ATP-binding cassette domain-containing protein [Lachnospiraceae bacterium]
MNLLTVKNLSKTYTDKVLLEHADFAVNEGDKIGIIGVNGTGKSTLLKLIAGTEEPDEGEIAKGNHVYINYLSQNPDFSKESSVLEYVIDQNRLQDKLTGVEGEAKSILTKLGMTDFDAKVSTLSGGQKKKVALAATLISDCEILLLDEPTNHLDSEMIEWLEEYLTDYKKALVMVTHDRYFLDLVCNRIVEIDRGELFSYESNYEGYLQLKQTRENMEVATQRKNASILRKEIAWMQRGARARATKQKAHIQRYEALASMEYKDEVGDVLIRTVSSRLGKKTVELSGITKAYGEKKLISDFSYIFLRDDRVGILGPNGCGKSTLMKIIAGQVEPDSGTLDIGDTVKIGYFSQENEALDDARKVIDYIRDTAEYLDTKDGKISASKMLEQFLFEGAIQYMPIGKLSGGEKRRLYLLKILMEAPNVLMLDEPTNDLDIATLRILEDYLDTFPGIVITISHDRYFLDRVAEHMLTFEESGSIELFNGTYTEYYQKRREKNKPEVTFEKLNKTSKVKTERPKFSYKEQREYESIESEIELLEERIEALEGKIIAAASDFVRLNQLIKEKEEFEDQLEDKMERFLYLSEIEDKIKAYERTQEG